MNSIEMLISDQYYYRKTAVRHIIYQSIEPNGFYE